MMKPLISIVFMLGFIASPNAYSNSESASLTEQMGIHTAGVN